MTVCLFVGLIDVFKLWLFVHELRINRSLEYERECSSSPDEKVNEIFHAE